MKKCKRLISLLLVLVMIFSLAPAAFAASGSFKDVASTDYFYEAVNWAVKNGITSGVGGGLFAPGSTCTRGQVVTFLWRSMGEPEPAGSKNPFGDVKETDYFYNAVLWAVEKGITSGISATSFGPNADCTRAQVVTFLWRTMGQPEPENPGNAFKDVADGLYYYKAVLWAVENGITSGVGGGLFAPDQSCTRGQIVCFLHRSPEAEPSPDPDPKPDPDPEPDPEPSPEPEPQELSITLQPESQTVEYGETALLSIKAEGGVAPYSYQWMADGAAISGAVDAEYEASREGSYTCTITDAEGKIVTSLSAVVTITASDPTKQFKIEYRLVEYNVNKGDSYISTQYIDNSLNPQYYTADDSFDLEDIRCEGYEFLGWYTANGTQITRIERNTTNDIILYARWKELTYDIIYKLYQTPLGPITDSKYLQYTVNKGLVDLPNPTLYNYIFLGWFTDDGKEVQSIPVGTTGDITLNAYWISKRNLTKSKALESPIIMEDVNNGVIYFTYEIGTIENVPVSDALWTIQSVSGLAQQNSQTVTTEISDTHAQAIANTISSATVDSGTWTFEKTWNESLEINEEWAEENGMSQEEAQIKATTSSNTYSVTDSNGGSDVTTNNDGTTTIDYSSQNYTHGNSAEFNVKVGGSYTNEGNLSSKVAGTYKVEGSFEGGYKQQKETNEHTGSDKTTIDTTVTTDTSNWNKATTSSNTKTASESNSVSKALTQVISNSKGYGKSYISGGGDSETVGTSKTDSESQNTSSTLTYSTKKTTTTTTTYSTDGKSEGCYRLVIAGTFHVFAVVGYDVASKSYFTYTFNIMDDKTYEFLDYSPNLAFNDYENGVLPFEIPYFVHEYVLSETASTEGLLFRTDSATKTASVVGYDGSETDVVVPSFISSGGVSFKVTSISPSAFAGKSVRAVILGDNITEIPARAFKDCTALEIVSGYFTSIGDEAFKGCVKLDSFTVSSNVTHIGVDAFDDVPQVAIFAPNSEATLTEAKAENPDADEAQLKQRAIELTQLAAMAAVGCGAENVTLNISEIIDDCELTLEVPAIESFELEGGGKTFNNLRVNSNADSTALRNLVSNGCTRCPLEISSGELILEAVSLEAIGFVLLASQDGLKVDLIKDNNLSSENKKAIVWRNPVLVSDVKDSAIGVLDVCGDIYVYSKIGGDDFALSVAEGSIIPISEKDFDNYIRGCYKVSFDPCGGDLLQTSKEIFYGQPYGQLPVPTKDYHTFDGWYTAPEGGQKVTEDSIFSFSNDIQLYALWTCKEYTVSFNPNGGSVDEESRIVACALPIGPLPVPTKDYHTFTGWYTAPEGGEEVTQQSTWPYAMDMVLYAQWRENGVSDWIPANQLPEGAEIVSEKWSYTETTVTESAETALPGYTATGNKRWVETGSGSQEYASFPGGFSKSHSIYVNMAKSVPYSAYETETTKRVVNNSWTGFVYWHWMYSVSYANRTDRAISPNSGYWDTNGNSGKGANYKYFFAMKSAVDCPYLDKFYCCSQSMAGYNCHSILPADKTNIGTPRCFRFDYYTSYYTDYQMYFEYKKVESKESTTEIAAGGNISDVQKWVQYREK